jgi:hypothetical protein
MRGVENKLEWNSFYRPSPDVRSDTRFMLLLPPFSAEIAPQQMGVNTLNSRHSTIRNGRFLRV